ncbi:MAG: cob(I)yrinic acid a,c-diamide adenosyltransferase [Deltaproteobacteria bacterium]|nr:cob(I)yrinic acid a,c-diamide adenosyltransferase [Deltaproteobacteria bacterium]
MVRIDKVYTRGGDGGETSLVGGRRVRKDDARVEAYGAVDELSSTLGLCRAALAGDEGLSGLEQELAAIQQRLFDLGAELASDRAGGSIDADAVTLLESAMDRMSEELAPLESFILPAGGEVAARLHLARTICRRAERRSIGLLEEGLRPELIQYLNRLSDYLFVAARHASRILGQPETLWTPGG